MAPSSLFARIPVIGKRAYCSCIHLNDAYILSAVRTPIGSFQGMLSQLSAVQLGTTALTGAVNQCKISKEEIQELVVGCTFLGGMRQAPDRQIALFSGFPPSVITSSVNKLCASGMKAIMLAAQLVLSNSQEVVAAGGIESLSNVPFILRRKNLRIGNICIPDTILHDALYDFFEQIDVTAFAELTAKEFNICKEEQDEYGLNSYSKAAAAAENGFFSDELVPVVVKKKDGEEQVFCEDEEIKRFDMNKYHDLKPEMGKDGTVTSGNSSSLSDGACMMILASGNYVLKKNLKPLARIVSFADGALEPKKFCIAPAVAIPRALIKANLCVDNISLWEISETFSLTAIANTRILRIDPDRVNIHGGCVSLGHPFGMTGARIVAHLVHTLGKGEFGCASVSHATGGASAMVIEKM